MRGPRGESWSASVAGGTGGPRWKPWNSAQPSCSSRLQLRRVLDALGAHAQLQAARDGGHGREQGDVLGVRRRPAQEGEVELDAVERQLGEPAERRVAHGEAVEHQRHAERLQPVQHVERARQVGDDVALGHLELQQLLREARLLERGLHLVGQRPLHELGRREVDGQPQAAVVALPLLHLGRRRAQDPGPDREDQAGEVGLRQEVLREHQPELGVLPAQQRLDARGCRRPAAKIGW